MKNKTATKLKKWNFGAKLEKRLIKLNGNPIIISLIKCPPIPDFLIDKKADSTIAGSRRPNSGLRPEG